MEELTEQLLRHSIIEGTDPGRGRRVRDQVYRVLAPELLAGTTRRRGSNR